MGWLHDEANTNMKASEFCWVDRGSLHCFLPGKITCVRHSMWKNSTLLLFAALTHSTLHLGTEDTKNDTPNQHLKQTPPIMNMHTHFGRKHRPAATTPRLAREVNATTTLTTSRTRCVFVLLVEPNMRRDHVPASNPLFLLELFTSSSASPSASWASQVCSLFGSPQKTTYVVR